MNLKKKLLNELRNGWSPKMFAIVAAIMGYDGVEWAGRIDGDITVTSDGFLIANVDGHLGAFLGAYSDLARNWEKLLDSSGLDFNERNECNLAFATKVRNPFGYKAGN